MARKKVRSLHRTGAGALPDRIRYARRASKLTQAGLGRLLDVVPSAVAQWESPSGTMPTVDHLADIAVATKTSFDWLATGRGPARAQHVEETAVISADALARDLVEERLLIAFRRLQRSKRDLMVRWIEDWIG